MLFFVGERGRERERERDPFMLNLAVTAHATNYQAGTTRVFMHCCVTLFKKPLIMEMINNDRNHYKIVTVVQFWQLF